VRVRGRGLTSRRQDWGAQTYIAAGNLERGDVSAADLDALDPRADRLDDAAEFMAKDVAFAHLHNHT